MTEEINIAFIFGGFIMGMVMPRHARLTEEVTRRIEDFVVTLLLPVFFVYTGLKTNVGLLDRPELWLITIVLIAVAIVGKLAGAAIAARVTGFDWRASAVIGTLMNTRGLTELIVLNLALSAGAISQRAVRRLGAHGGRHHADGRAAVETARPAATSTATDVEDEFAEAARLAAREHPELTVPERSILVAPQTDAALGQLIALAEPLARSRPPRELIIARPVQPPRGVGRRRARGSADREPAAGAGVARRSTRSARGWRPKAWRPEVSRSAPSTSATISSTSSNASPWIWS